MKQEDEEFEKLLGEIPQVTNSASQGAGSDSVGACTSGDLSSSKSAADHDSSLPGSEIFEQFFPAFQVVSGEGEGHLSSQSYPGVMATIISAENCSSRGDDMNLHLPNAIEEEEEPLASLGFAESHPHDLPDDASLIAAFERATLEQEPTPRTIYRAHGIVKNAHNSGEDMKTSTSLKHHLEFTKGMSMPTDLSTAGMPFMVPSNVKVPPKRLGLSNFCGNGYSVNVPYRQEAYSNCSPANSGITYAAGGLMYAYAPGIGTAHVRALENNMEYPKSYASPPFFGDCTSAQNGTVAFRPCNSISSHPIEKNGSVYYGSGFVEQPAGLNVEIHNSQIADRLRVPPSNLHIRQPYYQQMGAHAHCVDHQQDAHQDLSIVSHGQATKACKMHVNWQRKEEQMQRTHYSDPHSQALAFAQHQHVPSFHSHACAVPSLCTTMEQSCRPLHIEQFKDMPDWKLQTCRRDLAMYNMQGFVPQAEGNFACAVQGIGSRTDLCPPFHTKARNVVKSRPFRVVGTTSLCGSVTSMVAPEKPTFCPVRILSRDSTCPASTAVTMPCVNQTSETGSRTCTSADSFTNDTHLILEKHCNRGNLLDVSKIDWPKGQLLPQGKYSCLEEVEGHIYSVAKDQHGCRFLQRQFDEGGPKEVEKIFVEIIDHILELMTDPFGNYLVQKLLEVCDEVQRLKILKATTINGELINVSLNMHGTRAVQKLIETLTMREQVSMVTASLRPGVVRLIKDLNGNHVIQRCLQHLSIEDSQFIFEVVTSNCVEIATHRHGCCVLQRCIDFSKGLPQQELITEIAINALLLSQDPFGNYVVQYILDLGMPWVAVKIIEQLFGHFTHLSMQKFSSNVVEKCLKFADEDHKTKLVQELMEDSHLLELLQDPYANYVIQSALMVSKGNLHASLVDAICPHTPFLRSSPYGKRILSRRNLKKS